LIHSALKVISTAGKSVDPPINREWTVDEVAELMAWDSQAAKTKRLPQRNSNIGFGFVSLVSLPPAPLFQLVQDVPPVRLPTKGKAETSLPGWLGFFSIVVPGPFYAVAGQASPAAGAVSGDVTAGGGS